MFASSTTILSAIVAYLALGASASPSTRALEARGDLGGVNLNLACQIQNGGTGWIAVARGSGWADWRCEWNGQSTGVNVDAACAEQYGLDNAYATHGSGVYSWECRV